MIKIPSFLFVAIVMDVLKSLARGRANAQLDDEVCPEDVHSVEDKSHDEKVAVFEANDVPLVLRSGLVRVDICEKTERKDNDPKVDPDTCHHDVNNFYAILCRELGLHEGSAECYEDITGIMHNKDHRPCSDLIAHH